MEHDGGGLGCEHWGGIVNGFCGAAGGCIAPHGHEGECNVPKRCQGKASGQEPVTEPVSEACGVPWGSRTPVDR